MMSKHKKVSAAVFYGLLALYLFFLGSSYHPESLALAKWASKNIIFIPLQQNHLLQLFINSLVNRAVVFLGGQASTMLPLQVLDAFCGAWGAAVFYLFLCEMLKNRALALFGCLGLAFSYEYWRNSTILETHIIPIALLITSLYLISRLEAHNSPGQVIKAAVPFVLAVYLSGIYLVYLVSALCLILLCGISAQQKKRYALIFISVVIICWLIPFGIIGYFLNLKMNGQRDFLPTLGSLYHWFRGGEVIAGFKPRNIPTLIFTALWRTILGGGTANIPRLTASLLLSVLFLYGLRNFVFSGTRQARLFIFCLVSVLPHTLIQLVYETSNTQRYSPFLIFIWMILAASSGAYLKARSKIIKTAPLILCGLLFIHNLYALAMPGRSSRDPFPEISLFLKSHARQEDLICVLDGYRSSLPMHISYYTGRDVQSLEIAEDIQELFKRDALNKKQTLFIVMPKLKSLSRPASVFLSKQDETVSFGGYIIYKIKGQALRQ